jgi:hypothetical protein
VAFPKEIPTGTQALPEMVRKDLTFVPRELIQATLPHSDPGDVPAWVRKNGNYALTVQPGWDGATNRSVGYPYGVIPRLLMFWLTREVLRTKKRHIELGESLSAFMRKLGLDPSRGGKRSDTKRLREQMQRLFFSRISFQYNGIANGKKFQSRIDIQVAPKSYLWWSERDQDAAFGFGSWVELSEDFYNAIVQNPIPLDEAVVLKLKNSPLALDLYTWLSYSTYLVNQANKSRVIPWKALHEQFGAEYKRLDNFKSKAEDALKRICQEYPELNVQVIRGGVEVLPNGVVTPLKSTAKERNQLLLEIPESPSVHLKGATYEAAAKLITEAGTGWCKYALEAEFKAYIQKKGSPRNLDAAYLGFVRKKVSKAA